MTRDTTDLLTTAQVAHAVGRSKRTIHGWATHNPDRLEAAGYQLAVKHSGLWLYRPVNSERKGAA